MPVGGADDPPVEVRSRWGDDLPLGGEGGDSRKPRFRRLAARRLSSLRVSAQRKRSAQSRGALRERSSAWTSSSRAERPRCPRGSASTWPRSWTKIQKLDGKVINLDVEVSKEHNPRQADRSDRVEITLRTRGPVIRAEAAASDPYAALDMAAAKLEARLRKQHDKRRVHRGRESHAASSVAAATAHLAAELNGELDAAAAPARRRPKEARDHQDGAAGGAGRGTAGRPGEDPRGRARWRSTRRSTRWSWSATTSICSSTPRPSSRASSTGGTVTTTA